MSRLRLGLEIDGASRGRQVRDIVQTIARLHGVKGAAIVAADGFVIAAEVPEGVAVESLAALAATLGRDLEVGASRLGRGAFQTALFSADDGTLFLATSPIGFVVALAEPQANLQAVRGALAEAVGLIEAAWDGAARA
ncbi:MAG TPA: roadblock/LC7 domain-containing protein [Methylomirabilota bacterium]|jgi:predicted regulator of Ras-like GTPase activity (Roadblock/LC7/MglB family)